MLHDAMTLASYKRWLRRNESVVQFAELLISRGSWLLPDRFSTMEGPVELFRGLSGAVSVVHEHLLASTAVPLGSLWLAILSQACCCLVSVNGSELGWVFASSSHPTCNRVYATTDAMNSMQFEVLIEMGALHLEGTGQLRSKYTVLLLLEAVKCVHSCCTC